MECSSTGSVNNINLAELIKKADQAPRQEMAASLKFVGNNPTQPASAEAARKSEQGGAVFFGVNYDSEQYQELQQQMAKLPEVKAAYDSMMMGTKEQCEQQQKKIVIQFDYPLVSPIVAGDEFTKKNICEGAGLFNFLCLTLPQSAPDTGSKTNNTHYLIRNDDCEISYLADSHSYNIENYYDYDMKREDLETLFKAGKKAFESTDGAEKLLITKQLNGLVRILSTRTDITLKAQEIIEVADRYKQLFFNK